VAGAPSKEQANVLPLMLDVKLNDTLVELVSAAGPEVIVVCGAGFARAGVEIAHAVDATASRTHVRNARADHQPADTSSP
jgi:hypothetical protein